mmetsp:Transcript_23160/g.33953  ORF Transcript_23160/g.33953 Transcript_23160/m.33953 type:complete len:685 (+) Transcript_23160:159-2213(+)|eukprot:CAMPEP_0185039372 /NCGR_PEP_ID=MMETSP1103-20130426/36175_1 /TAXON_ID=36769 /ORGANISM="Paraphysomonas bandaiensis, Strain Caron Lab Isolate" /LENGTH=684 /DNA_ID=CAMNT_0027578233 /DNA_START=63 /DNA_END=2117 /DNA_ORIENTATION=-
MGGTVAVGVSPSTEIRQACQLLSGGLLGEYRRLKGSGDDDSKIYRSLRNACSTVSQQRDRLYASGSQTTVKNLALQRLTQSLRADNGLINDSAHSCDTPFCVKGTEKTVSTEVQESTRENLDFSDVSMMRNKPILSVDIDNEANNYVGKVHPCISPCGAFRVGEFTINQHIMTESSEFVEIKCLGSGYTSRVYEALHVPSMTLVALKMLLVHDDDDVQRVSSELRVLYDNMADMHLLYDELKMENVRCSTKRSTGAKSHTSKNRCNNVLGMYDAFLSPETGMVNIVVEYMDGGSLDNVVKNGGCQNEAVMAQITKQVLEALLFLRNKNQLHRDIKPGNILLNCNGDISLADFGLAKVASCRNCHQNSFVGTLNYMSPEKIMNSSYSFPSDIWSLGITLITVIEGKHPYALHGSNYWDLVRYVCDEDSPNVGPRFSTELRDFISLCLQKDPTDRPTIRQLLRHSFVTQSTVSSAVTTDESISPRLSFDTEYQSSVPTDEDISQLVDTAVMEVCENNSTASSSSSIAQLASHSIVQKKSLNEADNDRIHNGVHIAETSVNSNCAASCGKEKTMEALLMAARLEHMELILHKIVSKYQSLKKIKGYKSTDDLLKMSSFDESSLLSVTRHKERSMCLARVENMKPIPDPNRRGKVYWKHFAKQLHIPFEVVLLSVKNIIPDELVYVGD